jgi:catechol 2,3-dioxygenase-like lactoylglutathione lyase family enzyme
MKIKKLDHLVLTVNDIDMTITFYTEVLDMTVEHTAAGRKSLRFGKQKINLHKAGQEISPHARHPLPGSADICFVTETSMQQVIEHLNFHKITILAGPAERDGATGP